MKTTVAEEFFNDKRIIEAKKLISDALNEHKKKVNTLQGPIAGLEKKYEETLAEFGKNRGGNVFYSYLGSGFGNGALVELADGSTKYDFISGIGVHYFGHSHTDLILSQIDGAIMNTTMNGNLQQNTDTSELVKIILDQANINGGGFNHCLITSSGAMANENALKIMFQKRMPAHRILAFEKCFMGRTITISQITDKEAYRVGIPKNLPVTHIPFYDSYDHEGSIKRSVKALEDAIAAHPGEYSSMTWEVIQGEAGTNIGNKEFFMALAAVLKKNNISILVDEVQSFGRLETLFAFQYFGLDKVADVITIGKMSQVCATIYREDHSPCAGTLSQTFTSSSTAIKASIFVLNEIINNKYLGKDGKINKLHNIFKNELEGIESRHADLINGPYGIGAMVAMTIYKGDMEKSKDFTKRLYTNGVLSFVAGNPGSARVRFLMPIGAVTEHDIKEVCKIIEKTLVEGK